MSRWSIVVTRVPPGPDGRVYPADVIGTYIWEAGGERPEEEAASAIRYGGGMVTGAAFVSFTRLQDRR